MASEEKKGMGCWGIGCIVLLVIGLVIAGGAYGLYQWVRGFTATSPAQIPVQEVTSQQHEEILGRMAAFGQAIQSDVHSELALSADDINAIIAMNPDFKELQGKFRARIENSQLFGDVSFPLTNVPGFQGRYLNGSIGLQIGIENGAFKFALTSLEVRGKQVPREFVKSFGEGFEQGFNENLHKNPQLVQLVSKIKRLKIEGDKIILESSGSKPAVVEEKIPPESPPAPSPPEATTTAPPTTTPDAGERAVQGTPAVPAETKPAGKYIGMSLEDVKKQLGEPYMATEEGNTKILYFKGLEIYSTDGVTVTSEKVVP